MQPLTRYLALALIPLLAFLAVAIAGQAWLERETRRVQADAIAARRAQFVGALAITHRAPETWDEDFQRELGALVGGTVTLEADTAKPDLAAPLAPGLLAFNCPLSTAPGLHARIVFAAPPANRLIVLHQRMFVTVVLLAFVLIGVSVLLSLNHRPVDESGEHAPLPGIRSEMLGVEHFARISVERSEALKQESGARHRAEEDLKVSRTLLDHSMQARVQLGRELHDNICQTLYAVSLSLEAVRRNLAGEGDPAAGPRLDQCIAELRRLNHEVRSYLKDLEPDAVRRERFMETVTVMLDAQSQAGGPKLVRDLDPEAVDQIAPEQAAEIVNILREAVSNSIRHGQAGTIALQARRGEACVVFAVHDDGQGFDPAAPGSHGHGLANMQARAAALGGSVKITSAPGKGIRVLLTVPVLSETQREPKI